MKTFIWLVFNMSMFNATSPENRKTLQRYCIPDKSVSHYATNGFLDVIFIESYTFVPANSPQYQLFYLPEPESRA